MLVITAAPDSSQQYVPVMNCIFSAQKLGVPVDACVLGEADSLFLQQVGGRACVLHPISHLGASAGFAPDERRVCSADTRRSRSAAVHAGTSEQPRRASCWLLASFTRACTRTQTMFLPDARSRKHLVMPQTTTVDFRATCFCHSTVIEIGYVCPVCLSSESLLRA